MNPTGIRRRAIKRVFANLYGVSPEEVEVTSSADGNTITVHCAEKIFTHAILSDNNDDSPEFVSDNEDPITVRLTDEKRRLLERVI